MATQQPTSGSCPVCGKIHFPLGRESSCIPPQTIMPRVVRRRRRLSLISFLLAKMPEKRGLSLTSSMLDKVDRDFKKEMAGVLFHGMCHLALSQCLRRTLRKKVLKLSPFADMPAFMRWDPIPTTTTTDSKNPSNIQGQEQEVRTEGLQQEGMDTF